MGKSIWIEDPEDGGDDEEHELVDWTRNGEEPRGCAPADRPRNALVLGKDSHRADRMANGPPRLLHQAILGDLLRPPTLLIRPGRRTITRDVAANW